MNVEQLREKHPRFVYDSYNLGQEKDLIKIKYSFILEPDVLFQPTIVIPRTTEIEQESMENFAFHLGMVEAISYWKSACPRELLVKAGNLSSQQIAWWHNLFIHGLGELFFKNDIDFTPSDFLEIVPESTRDFKKHSEKVSEGDLILIGGGKDSTLTLEVLSDPDRRRGGMILNPTNAAIGTSTKAGIDDPIIINRTIDKKLLLLNQMGYVNGHTPFSAYLAFLGIFVGALNDYSNIISSNERGAGEGNVIFHGIEANHQYSKSFQFEKLFREYCEQYLSDSVQYFSFLRPLFDLQISELFAKYPDQAKVFKSCNVNQKENNWCSGCAKCAFVFLSLFPFMEEQKLIEIFGENLFQKREIIQMIRQLVGLGEYKPFECVGTIEESTLAVALSIQKYRDSDREIPEGLSSLEKELGISEARTIKMLDEKIRNGWSSDHFLPQEYADILKRELAGARK